MHINPIIGKNILVFTVYVCTVHTAALSANAVIYSATNSLTDIGTDIAFVRSKGSNLISVVTSFDRVDAPCFVCIHSALHNMCDKSTTWLVTVLLCNAI